MLSMTAFVYATNKKSIFIIAKKCRNFCSRNFSDFSRIFDKSKLLRMSLHPQLLHHYWSERGIRTEAHQLENLEFNYYIISENLVASNDVSLQIKKHVSKDPSAFAYSAVGLW